MSIYSNNDNPFNDANLGEKFVWTKKKDREKKLGLTPEEILRQEQQRREETQVESFSNPLRIYILSVFSKNYFLFHYFTYLCY